MVTSRRKAAVVETIGQDGASAGLVYSLIFAKILRLLVSDEVVFEQGSKEKRHTPSHGTEKTLRPQLLPGFHRTIYIY